MNHAAAGLVGGEDGIFGVIGVCAIITASLLLWMDRKRYYGLESPNIS